MKTEHIPTVTEAITVTRWLVPGIFRVFQLDHRVILDFNYGRRWLERADGDGYRANMAKNKGTEKREIQKIIIIINKYFWISFSVSVSQFSPFISLSLSLSLSTPLSILYNKQIFLNFFLCICLSISPFLSLPLSLSLSLYPLSLFHSSSSEPSLYL